MIEMHFRKAKQCDFCKPLVLVYNIRAEGRGTIGAISWTRLFIVRKNGGASVTKKEI